LNTAFGHAATRGFRAALPRDRVREPEEVLGALAEANPHIDYLGIEVHRSGVGAAAAAGSAGKTSRICALCATMPWEVLKLAIQDEAFDEVLIFFPDPGIRSGTTSAV